VLVSTQVIAAPHAVCPAGHTIWHRPATQLCVPGHTVPHVPQLVLSVCKSTQRPADIALAPQIDCPIAHAPTHALETHVTEPPAGAVHARPHAPQCVALVTVLVSQPFAAIPSQSPKPTLQRCEHTLVAHVAVWFGPATHARPQAPQCAIAVRVSVSQPFAAMASQLPKPIAQVIPQADIAQDGVAFGAVAHARPHAPQFAALVVVSTHTPLHAIVGRVHVTAHTPMLHICPIGHALPHAPQLARSVCRFAHIPEQKLCPIVQTG
jgi:hypothetical protein